MDFITVYPKIEPAPNLRLIWRRVLTLILICGCAACGIVNLCVGKAPWSLYAIGGGVVFWAVFLYHPMVEQSLIKKFTLCILSACGYLILIDFLSGGPVHWSKLVVPIVLFSLLILFILVFFIRFKRQKHNVFPLSWVFLISLAVILAAAFGLHLSFTWPIIVLAALDGLLLLLSLVLYLKPIAREFYKKFHFN